MQKLWITVAVGLGLIWAVLGISTTQTVAKQAGDVRLSAARLSSSSQSIMIKNSSILASSLSSMSSAEQSNLSQSNETKSSTLDKQETGKSLTKTVDFDDGISDWIEVKPSEIASIPLNSTNQLGYTFANVDGSITKPSYTAAYDKDTTPDMIPKFNIFLKEPTNQFASIYDAWKGAYSTYDYSIHYDKNGGLGNDAVDSIAHKFISIKYYRGNTDRNQPALKALGDVIIGGHHYQVELLMRPSPSGIIQQEMYIASLDDQSFEAGIYYAKDTLLEMDTVPLYAQGNNAGIYLKYKARKILANFNVPNGPQHFSTPQYESQIGGAAGGSTYGLSGYESGDFNSAGLDAKNFASDYQIMSNMDSTYTNKWTWQTFEPEHVYHFRTDLGIVGSGIIIPNAVIKYVNKTSNDGKNRVNDQLEIEERARNYGSESTWNDVVITSSVSEGLDVDQNSIKIKLMDGSLRAVDQSSYDPAQRTIKVKLPENIATDKVEGIVFNADVNNKEVGKDMTVSMLANSETSNYQDSTELKIPVLYEPVLLSKGVRSESDKNTVYAKSTESFAKDTLDYQITLDVDSASSDVIDGNLTDIIPKGLTLVPDSAQLKYSDSETKEPVTDLTAVKLKTLTPGTSVTLSYKVKVDEDAAENTVLKNTVNLTGQAASGDAITVKAEASAKIVTPKIGQVTFKYIDRRTGEPIGDQQITATGTIGKKISELTTADISGGQNPNKIRPAFIEGYTPVDLTDDDDLTTATFSAAKDIDPEIQAGETIYTIRYEKQRLAITALPRKMDFGMLSDTQNERTFYLPAPTAIPRSGYQKNPYHIEISDYWGIVNWSLDVKQQHQFEGQYIDKQAQAKSETAQKVILNGARLQFNNAKLTTVHADGQTGEESKIDALDHFNLDPNGTPRRLIIQNKRGHFLENSSDNQNNLTYDHPGYSVYRYQFGDEQSADYSIGLHVPATTKRYATHYNTKLQWNLTVAP
ncbi:WxL domain-containing protein [Latilactobacillus sakei]